MEPIKRFFCMAAAFALIAGCKQATLQMANGSKEMPQNARVTEPVIETKIVTETPPPPPTPAQAQADEPNASDAPGNIAVKTEY